MFENHPQPTYEDLLTARSAIDQILGLVGGRGIPALSGGLDISLGSITQLCLWSSKSETKEMKLVKIAFFVYFVETRAKIVRKLAMQFKTSLKLSFLTNYLIACCRRFILSAPLGCQSRVLETVVWAIIPLEKYTAGLWEAWLPTSLLIAKLVAFLPNAFGFSSRVKELSPSSSSDTSTSSSLRPFFGSQVILFSFFNLLLAFANQQLTCKKNRQLETVLCAFVQFRAATAGKFYIFDNSF